MNKSIATIFIIIVNLTCGLSVVWASETAGMSIIMKGGVYEIDKREQSTKLETENGTGSEKYERTDIILDAQSKKVASIEFDLEDEENDPNPNTTLYMEFTQIRTGYLIMNDPGKRGEATTTIMAFGGKYTLNSSGVLQAYGGFAFALFNNKLSHGELAEADINAGFIPKVGLSVNTRHIGIVAEIQYIEFDGSVVPTTDYDEEDKKQGIEPYDPSGYLALLGLKVSF